MKAIARHSRVHLGGFEERIDHFGRPVGGFNFDNAHRNALLGAATGMKQNNKHLLLNLEIIYIILPLSQKNQGSKLPRATKTGTTIVGLVFKDGIVLGADTRATGGSTVCDKNCEKIHYIAPNIRCCGAGLLFYKKNLWSVCFWFCCW